MKNQSEFFFDKISIHFLPCVFDDFFGPSYQESFPISPFIALGSFFGVNIQHFLLRVPIDNHFSVLVYQSRF